MQQDYTNLITPFVIGGSTAYILASLLQQHYQNRNTRKFSRRAKCQTVSSDVFEVYEDLGSDKEPRLLKAVLLSPAAVEKVLKQNAVSTILDRPGSRIMGWDCNTIACNRVNEDAMAVDLVPGDLSSMTDAKDGFWPVWGKLQTGLSVGQETEEEKSVIKIEGEGSQGDDMLLLSVFDGHGAGPEVAQLLSRTLHACLANAMAKQGKEDIGKTMQETIMALNKDIIRMPLTLVQDHLEDPALLPLLPSPAPALLSMANLPLRGACISSAIIDSASNKIYVANLGDCRVVGGWFNPDTKTWRCDVMSDSGDLNAQNPLEVEKALHPHDPDSAICDTGNGERVLGTCAITRAMGDTDFHVTSELSQRMEAALRINFYPRQVPKDYPPYLIDEPEIVSRDLSPASGEQLKFVILAVDGLWDKLSSEEACLLTAAHLTNRPTSTILKTDLIAAVPFIHPEEGRPFPAKPLPGTTKSNSSGVWTFDESDDAASHLLRNAFGRGDAWESQRMLSLKAPDARYYRDDTTVIFLNDGRERDIFQRLPSVSLLRHIR